MNENLHKQYVDTKISLSTIDRLGAVLGHLVSDPDQAVNALLDKLEARGFVFKDNFPEFMLSDEEHMDHHRITVDKFEANDKEHDALWEAFSKLEDRLGRLTS